MHSAHSWSLRQALHNVVQVVQPGDTVIDATCGNGYDTAALAHLAGPSGVVHGFDVQQAALDSTLSRLHAAGFSAQLTPTGGSSASTVCRLHLDSHVNMAQYVQPESASLVAFNLGYLPGQDHTIMTRAADTEAALYAMMRVRAGSCTHDVLQKSALCQPEIYASY